MENVINMPMHPFEIFLNFFNLKALIIEGRDCKIFLFNQIYEKNKKISKDKKLL